MKTIKIIDLVNMIANKEYDKLPKKIRYEDDIFNYCYDNRDGIKYTCKSYFGSTESVMFGHLIWRVDSLDDEVEIIEDTKKDNFAKKTMIFKKEYLDIIDGLALIKDMQIKDVLNQLLEKAINELDEATKEQALEKGKKSKDKKQNKILKWR